LGLSTSTTTIVDHRISDGNEFYLSVLGELLEGYHGRRVSVQLEISTATAVFSLTDKGVQVMSITRTQVFLANISKLRLGEGLGLGIREGLGARVFTCLNVREKDLGLCN